jgi:hypothetical protein
MSGEEDMVQATTEHAGAASRSPGQGVLARLTVAAMEASRPDACCFSKGVCTSPPCACAENIVRAVLEALRLPDDQMRRAWIDAAPKGENAPDMDELAPRLFTGQGDHEMVPRWKNVLYAISFDRRWRAAIAAALTPSNDDGTKTPPVA